ncbi:hypothetical protein [Curtobacterium sp. B8]|uniref:hypothetical protein n=1 Tax=Curtobacterium sp. B8 TaxID=95611 RepID=UPI0003478E68|nr:hypothetical protein [Curtobacterium sp. B8]
MAAGFDHDERGPAGSVGLAFDRGRGLGRVAEAPEVVDGFLFSPRPGAETGHQGVEHGDVGWVPSHDAEPACGDEQVRGAAKRRTAAEAQAARAGSGRCGMGTS